MVIGTSFRIYVARKKKHYSRRKTASMTLNTATAAANTLLSWNVQQGQHTLPTRPTTPKLHRSLPTWSTNPVLNCLFNKRLCKFSPSALSNLWIQEPRIECANYDIPALGDWGTCTVWLFIRITQWAPGTLILPSRSRQAWRSCTQYSASSFRIMHHVLFSKMALENTEFGFAFGFYVRTSTMSCYRLAQVCSLLASYTGSLERWADEGTHNARISKRGIKTRTKGAEKG